MSSWTFTLAGRISLGRRGAMDVRDLRTELRDLVVERRGGRMAVGGRLVAILEYMGRDGRVHVAEAVDPFRRVVLAAEGAAADRLPPRARVRAVQYALRCLPGREWGREVDYQVDLEVEPVPPPSVPVTAGAEEANRPAVPEPPIEPRYRLLRVDEVIGENRADFLVEQRIALDLPAVKVIDVHGAVTDLRAETLEDNVILQGTLFRQVYYVGEDGLIHYQHGDAAFEETVAVPGAKPGMNVQTLVRARESEHELLDGRQLVEKVELQADVKVTRTVDVDILTDLAVPPGVQVATDTVDVEQVVGRGAVRHLLESAVRLAAPAERVTRVVADAGPTSVQVVADKVIVEGAVQKQVFYVGRDGMEYHQAEEAPFSAFLEVPGARAGMQAQVEAGVEEVESELDTIDNRLRQRLLLRLAALVTEGVSLQVVTGISGPGIEADARPLKVERLVTQNAARVMIVRKATLVSRALRIVDVIGAVQDLTVEVIPDQVIVQGRVHQQVFFIDRHKVQRHQTEEAVFNHLIEAPGARPGMRAQVRPFVKYISTILAPEANSMTEKIILDLQLKVVETVALTAVAGVRLTGTGDGHPAHGVQAASGPAGAGEGIAFSLAGTLVPAAPPLEAPADLAAAVLDARLEGNGGRAAVSGTLRLHLYYTARDRRLYRHEGRVPFRQEVAAVVPEVADVAVRVRNVRWEVAPPPRGAGAAVRWHADLEVDLAVPGNGGGG